MLSPFCDEASHLQHINGASMVVSPSLMRKETTPRTQRTNIAERVYISTYEPQSLPTIYYNILQMPHLVQTPKAPNMAKPHHRRKRGSQVPSHHPHLHPFQPTHNKAHPYTQRRSQKPRTSTHLYEPAAMAAARNQSHPTPSPSSS